MRYRTELGLCTASSFQTVETPLGSKQQRQSGSVEATRRAPILEPSWTGLGSWVRPAWDLQQTQNIIHWYAN